MHIETHPGNNSEGMAARFVVDTSLNALTHRQLRNHEVVLEPPAFPPTHLINTPTSLGEYLSIVKYLYSSQIASSGPREYSY